jgi:hypothetical protein
MRVKGFGIADEDQTQAPMNADPTPIAAVSHRLHFLDGAPAPFANGASRVHPICGNRRGIGVHRRFQRLSIPQAI